MSALLQPKLKWMASRVQQHNDSSLWCVHIGSNSADGFIPIFGDQATFIQADMDNHGCVTFDLGNPILVRSDYILCPHYDLVEEDKQLINRTERKREILNGTAVKAAVMCGEAGHWL